MNILHHEDISFAPWEHSCQTATAEKTMKFKAEFARAANATTPLRAVMARCKMEKTELL